METVSCMCVVLLSDRIECKRVEFLKSQFYVFPIESTNSLRTETNKKELKSRSDDLMQQAQHTLAHRTR